MILLSLSALLPTLCNATHFSYDQGDIECPVGSGGVSYTLSVSISNLGASGYSFDTGTGVTTGSPSRISISGSFSGTIAYGLTELPTSDIAMSMSGKLKRSGSGSGSQPTWSASANAVAPFFVSPKEQVAAGEAPQIGIGASDNANWSMSGHSKSDSDSVHIEGLESIFYNTWSVANGTYTVTATKVGGTASDTASFTICQHGEWGTHTGAVTFELNSALLGKVNNAINRIPNVSITLDELAASYSKEKRVFCCNDAVEKEEIKNTKTFSAGATIGNDIPIWALPSQEFGAGDDEWGYDFTLEAGLLLKPGSISFGIIQEDITNQCDTSNCITTSLTGSWSPNLFCGIETIACVRVFGMEGCGSVEASGVISTSVGASLGYATEDCTPNGLTGSATIGDGSLTITAQLDGLGWQSTWELWEGASF